MNHGELTAAILGLLARGPATALQIQNQTGADCRSVNTVLRRITSSTPGQPQRANVSGWIKQQEPTKLCLRPLYKIGAGENVPKPPPDPYANRSDAWKKQREALREAGLEHDRKRVTPRRDSIFEFLERNGEATSAEIAEAMGLQKGPVDNTIKESRKRKEGIFRIAEYRRNERGRPAQVWSISKGRDAKQPENLSRAERTLNYYHRNRAKINMKRRKATSWIPFGL